MDYIQLGKFISYILRHHPESIGIKMDKQGYVAVNELIEKVNATDKYRDTLNLEILEHIVATNDKKRYAFNADKSKIRAVQGHSFHVDVAKIAVPPIILYHGTSVEAYRNIKKKGISKMNRDYVHLSKEIETAKSVALRHAKNIRNVVILSIDCKQMLADGYIFRVAENGVWLVDSIPVKYIKKMED